MLLQSIVAPNKAVKPRVGSSQPSAGLGRRLLKAALGELVQRSHETTRLHVVESNVAAIRFYGRHGGIMASRTIGNIFGHDVPGLRVEWRDLKDAV
jgi:ribosomal protein S18 acetylase RimI-like enzyme